MTNLQSLSIFLTERLMLAAQEIFKAVEVTVTEYHDEISRSRQENELLKSRLLEAGIQFYPVSELQPGLSVFHGEPCVGSERGDPGEKIQVKKETSASREELRVPLPQTNVPEEPVSPSACLENEQRIEEMLHPQMTDSSPSLQAHQCMQIKEETDESKSSLGAEIFCTSQSSMSDDPSSGLASNQASGLETELDILSSMHNASEMPLSSKGKSARHRQRVNSDPNARAEYLAKRKESYQRRKQLGKIKYIKSCDLPKTERKKQRAQWRAASKQYRQRRKMTEAVFNFIPLPMECAPANLEDVDVNSTAEEHSANTGQAFTDSCPLKEAFSLLHWCPPDQRASKERLLPQLRNSCEELQRELQLGKLEGNKK
ncbi:uncharacterized protein si:ch211-86h15.1 isoform X3 [Tachysurus vachellii]|uniref:uncharacterized protein si:ch211-86h15.1 isoform X3 n=1 Tax=Tachysurus vachellii TaxID=175792 RepID=UPI00296B1147|nr:uncharacterized protein si:ch211-86h15.1 isoform X3 [Tachysurus vachellii]